MKEIVTLFSCLPFTSISGSILPITSENFFLYFIAFIVTFFLLGIIIGSILNPSRRQRRTREKPPIDAVRDEREEPNSTKQCNPVNETEQQRRTDNQNQRNGNFYNNYWDYSKPKRRY